MNQTEAICRLILENPRQREAAQQLAERYPDIDRRELWGIIKQCERDLISLGFREVEADLTPLRQALAQVHPMWTRRTRPTILTQNPGLNP